MHELLVFPHSHFCEKAHWALDYKKVPYKVKPLVPGLHARTVKKLGCEKTSVPVLITDDGALQGFDQIVNHLDRVHPSRPLTASDETEQEEAKTFEAKIDRLIGRSVRTILYATLLDYPEFIRACFTYKMGGIPRGIYALMASTVRMGIHKGYVRSDEYLESAHANFVEGMAELNERLSSSDHLIGDGFTRTDMSVASLLGLVALPKEHPFPWDAHPVPCPKARHFIDTHTDTRTIQWVRKMYTQFRLPTSS